MTGFDEFLLYVTSWVLVSVKEKQKRIAIICHYLPSYAILCHCTPSYAIICRYDHDHVHHLCCTGGVATSGKQRKKLRHMLYGQPFVCFLGWVNVGLSYKAHGSFGLSKLKIIVGT